MQVFNHNIKFLRLKQGLSQQKMADRLGEKRGRIAAYEEKSNAPDDFKQRLAKEFGLDLAKFLTEEMDDYNYLSFITTKNEASSVNEPPPNYLSRSDAISLLMELKENLSEKDKQSIDKVIIAFSRLLEENGFLKGEITQLHKDMLDIARKV